MSLPHLSVAIPRAELRKPPEPSFYLARSMLSLEHKFSRLTDQEKIGFIVGPWYGWFILVWFLVQEWNWSVAAASLVAAALAYLVARVVYVGYHQWRADLYHLLRLTVKIRRNHSRRAGCKCCCYTCLVLAQAPDRRFYFELVVFSVPVIRQHLQAMLLESWHNN